ncbi:TWiK family of potassium channels protein 18-like [Aphis craccivora]|uniref:TWiK family of potassium channels protein 18-like n=1 Tax=Aphis craccivora TaxID=307492 RepID=A0A6G0YKU2_APHCR|nr:TWiK family of potassium channels protein 18-like [Aphis craccivora]
MSDKNYLAPLEKRLVVRNRREKSSKKSSSTVGTGSVQHTPPPPQQYNTSHHQRAELSPKSRKQQIGGNGGRPVYRLTSEAKHVLCECAEYQLANSPTHDHVAAHILRQLGRHISGHPLCANKPNRLIIVVGSVVGAGYAKMNCSWNRRSSLS